MDLLRTQFREIWIPGVVQRELDRLTHAKALRDIHKALSDGWIKSQALRDDRVARFLATNLDPGEAEAIALAMELSADRILLDERDARKAAERAGLQVTGVLGVLLRAKKDGKIHAVKLDIEALRTRARFFVSEQLEKEILAVAGE